MSDNYNTLLKDGKYYKKYDDKKKGIFSWEPAFNFTGPSTVKIAIKSKSPVQKKKKYKRDYMGADWMKKNAPEEWEQTKRRALKHSRKVKGTTLFIEEVEKDFPHELDNCLPIYEKYHEEHGISMKQASVYLTHLNRRRNKLKALSVEAVEG